VEGQQSHAGQVCGGADGSRHGVWDVVEFQIEEDFKTKARKLLNGSRAFGGKELAAHFEKGGGPADSTRHSEGWLQAVVIQGDD
jgi:hypothetical protein